MFATALVVLAIGGCFPRIPQVPPMPQNLNRNPEFSPDGTKIAYISNIDGDFEIYVVNAGGSEPIKITDNTAQDADPSWSPDGQTIVFSSDRSGEWELYIMRADGSDAELLVPKPEE